MKTIEEIDAADVDAFVATLSPLFEGAPRFLAPPGRRAAVRDRRTSLFAAARATAREMPEEEQIELLDAHPRIGADPATVSELSRRRAGLRRAARRRPGMGRRGARRPSTRRTSPYFGFRFVVFVAGRPRAEIIPDPRARPARRPRRGAAPGARRRRAHRVGADGPAARAAPAAGGAARGDRARGLALHGRRDRSARARARDASAHGGGRRVARPAGALPHQPERGRPTRRGRSGG